MNRNTFPNFLFQLENEICNIVKLKSEYFQNNSSFALKYSRYSRNFAIIYFIFYSLTARLSSLETNAELLDFVLLSRLI